MNNINTFKVGGCIRDKIMGLPINDTDFVVIGATPEQMLNAGFQQVGSHFPVFLDKNGDEFALARTETKVGAGHSGFITEHLPSVTLEADLARRDLTINAIAEHHITGEFIDPFNGQEDIKNKILRHVSSAFTEDPVRVLRIARFNARFGKDWKIAHETRCMVAQMIDDGALQELTAERVWKEMHKALSTSTPSLFFYALFELGALNEIFPELAKVDLEVLEFGFFNSLSNNPLVNFGTLMRMLDNDTMHTFFERFRVPTEFKHVCNLVQEINFVIKGMSTDNFDFLSIHLAEMLSKQHLTSKIVNSALESLNVNGVTDVIRECFWIIKDVNFQSLTDDEQERLTGAQIGLRLKVIRANRIAKLLKQKKGI